MDEPDEMTPEQKRWWNRLRRVLKEIPAGVELNARVGEMGIAPKGSRDANFLANSDTDDFWETEWDCCPVSCLDGRDSQI